MNTSDNMMTLEGLKERTERHRIDTMEGQISQHRAIFSELEFWFNQYINPELNYEKQTEMEESSIYYDVFNYNMMQVYSSEDMEIKNAKYNFNQHIKNVIPSENYAPKCKDIMKILINCLQCSCEYGDFIYAAQNVDSRLDFTDDIKITLIYRQHIFILYFHITNIYDRECYKIRNHHFVKYPKGLYHLEGSPENPRRKRIVDEVDRILSFPDDKVYIIIYDPVGIENSYELLDDF